MSIKVINQSDEKIKNLVQQLNKLVPSFYR